MSDSSILLLLLIILCGPILVGVWVGSLWLAATLVADCWRDVAGHWRR